jgi:FkbM family methyltransferase
MPNPLRLLSATALSEESRQVTAVNRYFLLIRRIIMARQLGFWFFGTSHTMLPNQLRLFGEELVLKYPNDPALISDVISILLDDEYGLGELRSPVSTVVDIGANIGLFSLWARHHFPTAMIHAYEPNDAICDFTAGNLKKARVVLFNEGVSSEESAGKLVLRDSSRLVATEKDPRGSVKLTGIQTVIERLGGRLDLLKIDCEGAEWDIFLRREALRRVRQIRMEYHLDVRHNMAYLETTISELGFKIARLIPNRDFGIAWLDNVQNN